MSNLKFLKLKQQLDKLGFQDNFDESSAPLVEKLLRNFMKVSELYQNTKTANTTLEGQLKQRQITSDPLELELRRINKENNLLHSELIKEEEIAEGVEARYSNLYKQVSDIKQDYEFVIGNKDQRIKSLIHENAVVKTKFQELMNKELQHHNYEGNGKVAIELRKKVGEIQQTVESLAKGLSVIPTLNNSLSKIEIEFLKNREDLRNALIEKSNAPQEISALRSAVLKRDKEIIRLQARVEDESIERLQNQWLNSMGKELSILRSYESQVKLLTKENKMLAESLEEVRNQHSLLETIRADRDSIKNELEILNRKYESLQSEMKRKDVFLENMIRANNESQEALQAIKETEVHKSAIDTDELEELKTEYAKLLEDYENVKTKLSSQEAIVGQYIVKIKKLEHELKQTIEFAMDNNNKAQIDAEISILKSQVNEKNKRIDDISEEMESQRQELEDLTEQLERKQAKIDSLIRRDGFSNERLAFQERLENLELDNSSLNKERQNAVDRINRLESEIVSLKDQLLDLTRANSQLKEDNEQKRKWLTFKDQEIKSLESLRIELETESRANADLKLSLLKAEDTINDLKKERSSILDKMTKKVDTRSEDTILRQKNKEIISHLELRIVGYEEEIARLTKVIELAKTAQVEEVEDSSLKSCSSTNKLREENEKLRIELIESKVMFEKLKAQLKDVSVEFRAYKEQSDSLHQEMSQDDSRSNITNENSKNLQKFEVQTQQLLKTIEDKDSTIETLEQRLKKASDLIKEHQSKLEGLESKNSKLQIEISRTLQENKVLEDRVSKLEVSTFDNEIPLDSFGTANFKQIHDSQIATTVEKKPVFRGTPAFNNSENVAFIEQEEEVRSPKYQAKGIEIEVDESKEGRESRNSELSNTVPHSKPPNYPDQRSQNPQQHQEDVSALIEELKYLRGQNMHLENELRLMHEKLEMTSSNASTAYRELLALRSSSSALTSENLSLEEKCVFLSTSLKKAKASISSLTSELNCLEEQMSLDKSSKEETAALLSEIRSLKVDNSNLAIRLQAKEEEVREVEEELHRARAKESRQSNGIPDLKEENSRLKDEVRQMRQAVLEVEEEREKNRDLQHQLKAAKDSIERLESKLRSTESHLKDVLYESRSKDERSQRDRKQLIDDYTTKIEHLSSESRVLSSSIESLNIQLKELSEENQHLHEKLLKEKDLNDKLTTSIKNLERQKMNSSVEIDRMQNQISQLRVEVEDLASIGGDDKQSHSQGSQNIRRLFQTTDNEFSGMSYTK